MTSVSDDDSKMNNDPEIIAILSLCPKKLVYKAIPADSRWT